MRQNGEFQVSGVVIGALLVLGVVIVLIGTTQGFLFGQASTGNATMVQALDNWWSDVSGEESGVTGGGSGNVSGNGSSGGSGGGLSPGGSTGSGSGSGGCYIPCVGSCMGATAYVNDPSVCNDAYNTAACGSGSICCVTASDSCAPEGTCFSLISSTDTYDHTVSSPCTGSLQSCGIDQVCPGGGGGNGSSGSGSTGPTCGDGTCDSSESYLSCPTDCSPPIGLQVTHDIDRQWGDDEISWYVKIDNLMGEAKEFKWHVFNENGNKMTDSGSMVRFEGGWTAIDPGSYRQWNTAGTKWDPSSLKGFDGAGSSTGYAYVIKVWARPVGSSGSGEVIYIETVPDEDVPDNDGWLS